MRHLMRRVHCSAPRLLTSSVVAQVYAPLTSRKCHNVNSKLSKTPSFSSANFPPSQRFPRTSTQQDLCIPISCHASSNEAASVYPDEPSSPEELEGILLIGFLNEELPIITQHLFNRLNTGSGQTLPFILPISTEDLHLTPSQAIQRAFQQSSSHNSATEVSASYAPASEMTVDISINDSNSSASSTQSIPTGSRSESVSSSDSDPAVHRGTPAVLAGRLVFFTGTSWHSLAGPLNDELVELGLAPALVASATSPADNEVEVREVVRCLRQAHADYFELWQPLRVDQQLIEEVGVPEDARVTLSVALDAGEVPSITGQYRRDESHLVVIDGLLSSTHRSEIQEWLTAADHDHEGQPPEEKWERSCVDREGDVPTWGLSRQVLEALKDDPPPAIVALQSALAALYPEFHIRHMPAPILSDAELPSEEEAEEGEDGPEPLSSFVGNAVMYGDSVAWHVDADPASFPSYSPWVHNYGYYINREPGRPLFVSMLLYFNDSWPEDYHSETLFLDPETNSGVFVRPVPGRVVLMDQDMTHRISVPSKDSQGPRYSLVWKLVFFPKANEQASPETQSGSKSESSQGSVLGSRSSSHQESNAGASTGNSAGWGDGSGMEGMLSICRPEWGPPIRFGSASPARAGVKAVANWAPASTQ